LLIGVCYKPSLFFKTFRIKIDQVKNVALIDRPQHLSLKGICSMPTLTTIAVAIVALIHVAIAAVEIFFWETPVIYERLGFTAEVAHQVAAIVQNAGLYNGFIAAGLLWSLFTENHALQTKTFFLVCVLIAGIFGGITLSPNTLILQSFPALLALILVWSTRKKFGLQPD
jgi:putative membrane protein